MKFVAILSLAVLLPSVSAATCLKYVCDPSGVTWTSDAICGQTDAKNPNTEYDIRSCPTSGQKCSGTEATGYMCAAPPTSYASMYPGEPCNDVYTCITGQCTGGKCPVANASGAACKVASDCGVGFTCSTTDTCVELAAVGKACTVDTDCVANAGCSNLVCTVYNSIAAQQSVGSCTSGTTELALNQFCASSYCYTGKNGATCAAALPNSQKIPFNCNATPCSSTTDSGSTTAITGPNFCVCSYDGNSYCDLFPGDPDYVSYTSYQVSFFTSSSILTNCHTFRKTTGLNYMSPCNTIGNKPSDKMKTAFYRSTGYGSYTNSDSCVLKILADDYYSANEASSWLVLSGVLLALMN